MPLTSNTVEAVACAWCNKTVPGTRSGYNLLCPPCLATADQLYGAEVPDDDDRPPYASPRHALAAMAAVLDRARGVRQAGIPDPDRVSGGKGTDRAERIGQAAIGFRVAEDALADELETGDYDERHDKATATVEVLCAQAIGCWDGRARRHGDFDRDWADQRLGKPPQGLDSTLRQARETVGGALRRRGLVPDRWRKGEHVEGLWQGWEDIGKHGPKCGARKARALHKDAGLPVFYLGSTPCLTEDGFKRWVERRQRAAEDAETGKAGAS
ncbi:hypothetical protein HN937_12305 [Candidatus Poribacteria bacterium]|jgi:hypothetical protein|nr:hypothetical protein [Candidatus Poribacteria bacterium]